MQHATRHPGSITVVRLYHEGDADLRFAHNTLDRSRQARPGRRREQTDLDFQDLAATSPSSKSQTGARVRWHSGWPERYSQMLDATPKPRLPGGPGYSPTWYPRYPDGDKPTTNERPANGARQFPADSRMHQYVPPLSDWLGLPEGY